MAEVSIASAVAKLEADTQKTRAEGLQDLKRVLGQERYGPRFDNLTDDAFHRIFELLFKIVSRDKPVYLRQTSKPTTQRNAASRLESTAAALRLAVEVGVKSIKFRTALSVLDHIVQTLPIADGSICQPLQTDYLKSFKALLEHGPHCEHMRMKQWQYYVDFAVDTLGFRREDTTQDTDGRSDATTFISRLGQSQSIRLSDRSLRGLVQNAQYHEELVSSLKCLTATSNAPIMSRATEIVDSLIGFLKTTSRAQEAAFETLNNVVAVSLTEKVSLAHQTVLRLIPIIRRLWSHKSAALRDQMLIMLHSCRFIFVTRSNLWPDFDPAILTGLLETMLAEYYVRNEREILHFDDLRSTRCDRPGPLQCLHFCPLRNNARSVTNCLGLTVTANLLVATSKYKDHRHGIQTDELEGPRKRQKTQSPLERVKQLVADGHGQTQLAAIQIFFFLLNQPEAPVLGTIKLMLALLPGLAHEDAAIQTWIYLVLARSAYSTLELDQLTANPWPQIWRSARRAITAAGTVRAACYVLYAILDTKRLSSVATGSFVENTLFGENSGGPCSMTDTSLLMMTSAVRSVSFDDARSFETFANKILGWLSLRWTLPPTLDRIQNAHLVFHARAEYLYALLTSLCGATDPIQYFMDWTPAHPTWAILLATSSNADLQTFLHNIKSTEPAVVDMSRRQTLRHFDHIFTRRLYRSMGAFLSTRLKEFRQAWMLIQSERTSNTSPDIVELVTVVLAVWVAMATRFFEETKDLNPSDDWVNTWDNIIKFIKDENDEVARVLTIRMSSILLQLDAQLYHSPCSMNLPEYSMILESALSLSRRAIETSRSIHKTGMNDLDDEEFVTQSTQGFQTGSQPHSFRIDLPLCHDEVGLLAWQQLKLTIALAGVSSHRAFDPATTSTVIKEILSFDAEMLLAARGAVCDLLALNPGFKRAEATQLLRCVATYFLQEESFERCEAALCFSLQTMKGLAHYWISDEADDELAEVSFDVYEWFLRALSKSILSPAVLSKLSDLFDRLMLMNPSYGAEDLPSPRTSLLKILQIGSMINRFRLSDKLSRIFERFVLKEHEQIFQDVIDHLPSNPEIVEGIAIRLHIISRLGSRWHTILRQATYKLYETAAGVPSATTLACNCVWSICQDLGLESTTTLFRIFAPQILYTWLATHDLGNMPFAAFGYSTLKDLLIDNLNEFVGQIALRGSRQAEEFAQLVGQEWKSLLLTGFAVAEAYTLSSETSVPKHERLYDGSEKLVRKQIGSDRFLNQLREYLPDIVAQLVISLQDDRAFDKGLEKHSQSKVAAMWQDMCSSSGTSTEVPLSQQPCFRARCLPDELNYLCARLEIASNDLWSPALSIYVYRSLLSRALPALGPLHACSIIRKVRAVVSLAGPAALRGYPLEMLLHNLRPYLTIFECAEDTMGIYRYLLQQGADHLQNRISFIAGLGVSIFASLTRFITSSQDSTTQESHFLATISAAQNFRSFLAGFLETLEFPDASVGLLTMYRRIIENSRDLSQPGNSARSTKEGSLLLALLEDRSSESPLLTSLHFDISLEILCRDFSISNRHTDDIMSDDITAAQVAKVLLSAIRTLPLNDAFNQWAASVIGRGFIMCGMDNSFAKLAGKAGRFSSDAEDLGPVVSYTNIIAHLADLLWKPDMKAAELAERTLQLISTKLPQEHEEAVLAPGFDKAWFADIRFNGLSCPPMTQKPTRGNNIASNLSLDPQSPEHTTWAIKLLATLESETSKDPILAFLRPLMHEIPHVADTLLPYIVHLSLLHDSTGRQGAREKISQNFSTTLRDRRLESRGSHRLILRTLLYLRCCPFPGETNAAKRETWLDISLAEATTAAADCHMYHEALLFLELHHSQSQLQSGRSSRKSLVSDVTCPEEVIAMIYENVDDPDLFYGRHEDRDLQSVIKKLGHEGASQKYLSFQSALLDSRLKLNDFESLASAVHSTASALSAANMQGISDAVNQYYEGSGIAFQSKPVNESPSNGWSGSWGDQCPTSSHPFTTLFQNIQGHSNSRSLEIYIQQSLEECTQDLIRNPIDKNWSYNVLTQAAILAEAQQTIVAAGNDNFESFWSWVVDRDQNIKHADFSKLLPLLVGREAVIAALRRSSQSQNSSGTNTSKVLLQEIRILRQSLSLARDSEGAQAQFSLNRAMNLSDLDTIAVQAGIRVDVAVQYDLANTLWAQNETSGSIKVLQGLSEREDLDVQSILVTKAEILTDLGHKVAEARLEKPDEIIDHYLLPAFKELHGKNTGAEAGRVFHNFAAFCDMQLQDTDNLDDFTRIGKIRDRKLRELNDLERMVKSSEGKQKDQLKMHLSKTKTWFKLDDEEWKRLTKNREALILQCLENYLLSMTACDEYRNDTLRFLALWLNQADSRSANASVRKYLSLVPTRKFAPLVNQLSSRLLDTKDEFQLLLMDLMFRICSDHPYHSLYQVFSTSKSKAPKTDDLGTSRNAAASKLADLINKKSPSAAIWVAIHNSNIGLHRIAQERLSDKDAKTNAKIPLRKLPSALKLEQVMTDSHAKIPPPTMNISLRPDRDYSQIPAFSKFEPEISIAGGVSAPKIMTMIAVDGSKHKMLLKGGNDDLRQDAIMEQVFEQVSNLLKDHRTTRQRNLGIRTYKVIPLTQNAGIIEFVKDTLPLHEYLLPAHKRYFPKDLKPNECRSRIADAQNKGLTQRLQAYRSVISNFHPVMRFFFMEHFLDPDDWFYRRLNYSRSTAAVSILGHVLGLGDRHGHNILLDMKSGEVVHIDLGVAFEAGRVLPVPEVVPFRLTRDLVDGMGLTGVEGVFRRCCNFTLEALRRDQEAIMTILDVLRYDPLYTWSISPLRLARIQEHNEQAADAAAAAASTSASASTSAVGAGGAAPTTDAAGVLGAAVKRDINEPSEADRALTVVAKKLGKSLSVEATVNELIRQATDERNLAVLYCGWAAYA